MRLYYTGNETGIVDISFNNGYSWYRTDLDSLKNGLYLEDRNQNFSEIVIKSKSAVLKNLDILQKIKLVENKEEFRFVKVMPTHPIDKQTVLYVGEANQIKANQIKTTEISGENNSTVLCKTKLKAEKGIIIPIGRPENLENGMIWLE